jgi:hypothetical protein
MEVQAMEHTDKEIDALEEQIPALAAQATRAASTRALEAGLSVVISENGVLYRVHPNGTREAIAQPSLTKNGSNGANK